MTLGFLLDTNVVSAAAPGRRSVPEASKALARGWMVENAARLFLPVTVVADIAAGIGIQEGAGATRRAAELAAWLAALLGDYAERVIVFDAEAALHARALARRARSAGTVVGFADLAVGCIARARGLVVATRNVRDFAPMGVETLDPFVH